jgi:hypothetical protein
MAIDDPPNNDNSKGDASESGTKNLPPRADEIRRKMLHIKNMLSAFRRRPGVYSAYLLHAAGFQYTDDGDTARCDKCKLEVSNWTIDMDPFAIHAERKPDCAFVRCREPSRVVKFSSSNSSPTTSTNQTNSNYSSNFASHILVENSFPREGQERTFSHWPNSTIPSRAQMVEAGFFSCNVGDRVICLYCNLICQRWTETCDPCEVHKTFSPDCPYVKNQLIGSSTSSIPFINEFAIRATSSNHATMPNNLESLRSNMIVNTAARNSNYAELSKRLGSFATWPNENMPPVDDLVRAGFYYTGKGTTASCFYCNGSLQKWNSNDDPRVEHVRCFPHCGYAKQLCGDEMYRKIQESKRAQQGLFEHSKFEDNIFYFFFSFLERAGANEAKEKANAGMATNNNSTTNIRQLWIPDENTLSRLVAARLDRPISQRLLDQNFKLSVIKRCWEDQLRLKRE